MSESILAVFNYALLAAIYVFLWYVLRAVWAEVSGPSLGARAARRGREGVDRSTTATAGRSRGSGSRSIPTKLLVLEPAERKGSTYPLAGELVIGRADSCNIQLPHDTFASALHTRIWVDAGGVWIEDLDSRNGTMVNSSRLTDSRRLCDGDRIRIGETLFEAAR